MDKISKWDLHIHSFASKPYETDIVDKSTFSNCEVLIQKLEENYINVFSITDHNTFDSNLFIVFKESIKHSHIIEKVLAGVEFTILLDDGHAPHVRVYFDINDDESAKNLERTIKENKDALLSKSNAKENNDFKFTLDSLNYIIREIGVSIIVSFDQNTGFSWPNSKIREIKTEEKMNLFKVITAVEVKSLKAKSIVEFSSKNGVKLPSIFGSDCHSWEHYPRHDAKSNSRKDFYFESYAQPTFLGLMLTLTFPVERMNKTLPVFANPITAISINDKQIDISRGVNVIIGENGSGKTTIASLLSQSPDGINTLGGIKEKLIKKNQIEIVYKHKDQKIPRKFSIEQGEIIKRYNTEKLLNKEIDIKNVISNFEQKYTSLIDTMLSQIKHNILVTSAKNSIDSLAYDLEKITSGFYTKITPVEFGKILNDDFKDIFLKSFNDIISLITNFENEVKIIGLEKEFKEFELIGRFIMAKINFEYAKFMDFNIAVSILNQAISSHNLRVNSKLSSFDKKQEELAKKKDNFIKQILELGPLVFADLKTELQNETQKLEDADMTKSKNEGAFEIYASLNVLKFKGAIFKEIAKHLFTKGEWNKIFTFEALKKKSKAKDEGNVKVDQVIDSLKEKSVEYLKTLVKFDAIVRSPESNYDIGHTFGEVSKVFYKFIINKNEDNFDVLIIDQPEDNISQKSIKKDLIDLVNSVRSHKQIFIVTHSPILAFNLDPDNVIFLENKNLEISFKSGALDQGKGEIINLICENMDSGLETINERLRLYEV